MGTDSASTVAVGFVVALLCGAAWGVFNGFCITRLRVSALISTLGSMGAALGAAYLVTDGNDIRTVPNALIAFGHGSIGGVPWLVVITAVVSVIGGDRAAHDPVRPPHLPGRLQPGSGAPGRHRRVGPSAAGSTR